MSRISVILISSAALLFAVGLVMIFNTTSAEVLDRLSDRSTHYSMVKQLLYAVVGLIAAFGVWCIGYQPLVRLSGSLLVFFTGLLVLVFVPGIGQQLNGAHRWITICGSSFQPSECVKYLIPFYVIHVVCVQKGVVSLKPFIFLLLKLAVPLGLILIEPDNGTVAILLATLVILFILMRVRWTFWALPLTILSLIGAAVASQMPHVAERLRIYLHPESDILGKGHQPHQAKIAAGSGRLLGKGIGESLQKMEYLPEARSDYIAAIFAEECGFVGIFALICIYMVITYCGLAIAHQSKNTIAFYTAATITFLIAFQAFLNLGVVSGLLPSKGTNLPLFSQGGSSLLAHMMALSLLLNIAKGKKEALL